MNKNNHGYVLLELIISMTIIFVIIIQFITLTLDMYKKNIEITKENNLNNNIYTLYREIGYDFINYNVKSIKKINNEYVIEYYRNNKSITNIKKLNFSDNKIIYSEDNYNNINVYTYKLVSDKNIKINSNKSKMELDKGYLKLTLNINNNDYEFICSNKIEGVSI